ncbi:MAG: prepilin-type N-terminal cleavage/methylation domain-containing protein [Candidatus Izemoplasmataceae bacterium]
MIKNQKGVTLFELLVTISISSLLIALLFSLLSTTLITKNVVDYTNRLDDEVFDLNDYLTYRFQRLGYKSILEYPLDESNTTQDVFLITTEFEPTFIDSGSTTTLSLSRDVFKVYILFLDVDRNAIYFDLLFEVDTSDFADPVDDQIALFLAQKDAYVSQFINSPTRPLNGPNITLDEGSYIRLKAFSDTQTCIKLYQEETMQDDYGLTNLVSSCQNAYLDIRLIVRYTLENGNSLEPKEYVSTLFF